MSLDQSGMRDEPRIAPEPAPRKAWTQPAISQLRAGAAENIPGSASPDGPLETIGS
ncbi:MAG TPA: hypothetical protein VF548_04560 [Allosphingosinicella sp.]|jgi:hypothetical protein